MLLVASVLKPILTGLTVGAGGVAGVFAPALFSVRLWGFAFAMGLTQAFGVAFPVGHSVLAGIGSRIMWPACCFASLTRLFWTRSSAVDMALPVPLTYASADVISTSRALMRHSIYNRQLARTR